MMCRTLFGILGDSVYAAVLIVRLQLMPKPVIFVINVLVHLKILQYNIISDNCQFQYRWMKMQAFIWKVGLCRKRSTFRRLEGEADRQ